ncbi:HAAS signaling domain-containing protein [Kribbella shirazensis]|uniref:DUF1700 domain-containing protein n=1 Tax=Kribbella shirazensis TaxID=1105143 RepID=A0A7X6A3R5_9ACTN|nr:hypothetical protein [Kribbella shirazensis]NIK60707.1 hypothetical protein [Kribbella shirazensis]
MNVEQDTDQLVEAYLKDLAAEAAVLPAGRRDELLADMRAHIAEARAAGATSEDEVRQVLQRLGQPRDIVAAATEGLVLVEVPPRLRPRDFIALGLLFFGPFLLVIGWLVGVWLLWTSNRWSRTWKFIGTIEWPLFYALALACEILFQPRIGLILVGSVLSSVVVIGLLMKNARPQPQRS